MHGPELVKLLSSSRPGMKVIYMSGYTDTTVTHRDLVDSGVDFLQKPLAPDVLARTVRAVLDRPL
jgi:FixJ family two-component response regulator